MATTLNQNGVRDEDSLRFFHVLSSRDPNTRKHSFDMIRMTLDAWANGYGSPKDQILVGNGNPLPINPLVEEHLPDILRLSTNCPFEDVREWCSNLLADIQENCSGIKIPRKAHGKGPSKYIPESEIVPVSTSEDQTQMLFVDAFLQNNRLDHVTQLMGYHPNYLEMFLRTQQYLLRGDGPLPFHYRHYIAIMAASRHQCAYLIHLHEQEFILQGGDQDWLKGPAFIPTKLRKLHEVNKILAHRPWLFNKSHIEGLRKEAWSVSELVQAIVIMAHFHALSSFVFGCGIKNEPDHHGGFTYRPHSPTENSNDSDYTSDSSSDSNSEPEVGIEILMERMKKLKESQEEEPTEEERRKRFEKVEFQSAELTKPGKKPSPKAEIIKYVQDEEFCYIDFTKRGCTEEAPTFRANEYSWDDHGFSIANRLYSEIGNLLDEKFSMAYNLTYYTMGEVIDVDTSAFRRAIWYYIHCLYGIMHDDYDYGQVNQLLERNLKQYIKTVTCYPERLTKKDYDNVMKEFKHSEKVHVNLMLLEARLQGELLYALRGVMQYMT